MNRMLTISLLFDVEPFQWGLRGDPYLWEEMKEKFNYRLLPETPEELESIIVAEFETITGKQITDRREFKIERFSHGGMSSGYISPEFWREKAIPLIISRYNEY